MKLEQIKIGDIVRSTLCGKKILAQVNGIIPDVYFSKNEGTFDWTTITFVGKAYYNNPRHISRATKKEIVLYKLENGL